MTQEEKQTAIPKLRFSEFKNENKWTTESLGSLATIVNERVGDRECVPMSITSGVGLVSQIEKFGRIIAGDSYKNYVLIRKNDFAYNKSATKEYPEGFIAHYSGDEPAAVPNSIFTCFRINGDSPDPRYLNYLFLGNLHGRWLRKFIEVGARAHGSLSVKDDDLLALPIPLPVGKSSLAEQQKIAECLSTLDELIEAESRKLDALKDHKKGLMQQLFPREGETRPRLRFPEFCNAPEWTARRLGDACSLQAGMFVRASEIKDQYEVGLYPCYGGNGLRGYTATFTHDGAFPLVGRQGALCGNVKFCTGKFHATEHALVATPKTGIDVKWLYYALDFLNLNRFATGQAQPGLSVDVLEKVHFSAPDKVDEQHRIAACLSSLDDLIAAQSEKLKALRTHKRGLMQQLFPSSDAIDP